MEEELDFDFGSVMDVVPPEVQIKTAQVAMVPHLEIVLPNGVDIRETALSLIPFEKIVKDLAIAAQGIRVVDEETRKKATEIGLTAKKIRLKVETIKKSPMFVAAEGFVRDIRHLCKTLTDPLSLQVEGVVKRKLTSYTERLRLEQQRREATAREEARQLQATIDAEAQNLREEAEAKAKAAAEELAEKEAAGELSTAEKIVLQKTIDDETEAAGSIVAPIVVVRVTDQPPNVVRTEEGASYTRGRWTAELVDESLVERKYLIVDMRAAQKDVDAGVRNIPGFRIYEKLGTSLR